jgi:predicted O-methyltransferase YrrM
MKRSLVDRLSNTWVDRVISRLYAHLDIAAMSAFNGPECLALIREIRNEDGLLLCRPSELFMVHAIAAGQTRVPGDYAEVGVYRGASAKLMCEAKGEKDIHLFDTFAGLPGSEAIDIRFRPSMFSAQEEAVRKRLAKYEKVHIYPGVFPGTAGSIRDKQFAFVHIDIDIYQSTRDCLELFYPRMSPSGIIISHDYPSSAGVRKAFEEFFADKRENVVNLPMSQCMVIKLV